MGSILQDEQCDSKGSDQPTQIVWVGMLVMGRAWIVAQGCNGEVKEPSYGVSKEGRARRPTVSTVQPILHQQHNTARKNSLEQFTSRISSSPMDQRRRAASKQPTVSRRLCIAPRQVRTPTLRHAPKTDYSIVARRFDVDNF